MSTRAGVALMSYQIKPLLKLYSLACASVLLSSVSSCGVPADGDSVGELRGTVLEVPILKPDLVLTDTEGGLYDLSLIHI